MACIVVRSLVGGIAMCAISIFTRIFAYGANNKSKTIFFLFFCLQSQKTSALLISVMSNIYKENGYENRQDYLKNLAEDHGADIHTVSALADLLGPDEDFDGLVTSLEDMEDMDI